MTRTVEGLVNYTSAMAERPRYYANDHTRDILVLEERTIRIVDARDRPVPPSLETEGFALVKHHSEVSDFRDTATVMQIHPAEIEGLVKELSGADRVVVNSPGVLRFSESSEDCGRLNNSRPARFIHIDISDATARAFAERACPQEVGKPVRRFAHYNVWRALSPPPQDVPLAVCDSRSVSSGDLLAADAVFDVPGKPEWSFEGLVIRHNAAHRWSYFSNMTREEALVFKTNDSDPSRPHNVPHSAFNDPSCPIGAAPRASIEMRAIAYWFDK
jgi:hypothetical protein